MRKTLYASVSLNGQLLVQEKRSGPPPPEVISDFIGQVKRAGNMIMGRKSAQPFITSPAALEMFGAVKLVVLSNSLQGNGNFVTARSAAEALDLLADLGFENAFIAGGGTVYDTFLSQNLVDELIVNIAPEVTTDGIALVSRESFNASYELVDIKNMSPDILQLRYGRRRWQAAGYQFESVKGSDNIFIPGEAQ